MRISRVSFGVGLFNLVVAIIRSIHVSTDILTFINLILGVVFISWSIENQNE